MSLPKTMKAVMGVGKGKAEVAQNVPVPSPIPDNYVLVKVSHVALNPTDYKHIWVFPHPGTISGCDLAGTVVAQGRNLARTLPLGARIAGIVHGAHGDHSNSGAFAEYALVKSTQCLLIPPNMSDGEAACLGVSTLTTGLALYQQLNLPWPDQVGRARTGEILIYGGSSATGLLAIQLAKLSGYRVLTTASKRHFETLKVLGADEVFEYANAEKCIEEIRGATGGSLELAFDTIHGGDSARICLDSMTQEKGRASFVTVSPLGGHGAAEEKGVWANFVFAYTSFGYEFEDTGRKWEAKPGDAAFAARWWLEMERLCGQGKIKLFPVVREHGLAEGGIIQGLEDLMAGKVSGGKLVYSVG